MKNPPSINSHDWEVNFQMEREGFYYNLAGLGMKPHAKMGYDYYDDVTPPRFSQFLDLNFIHPTDSINLTRDIVPPRENFIWNFTISSQKLGEQVSIQWNNLYFGLGNKTIDSV